MFPLGKISFTKPSNLGHLLNTSSEFNKLSKTFSGKKYNKCALCGNHGRYRNMIYEKDVITIHKNNSIRIKPNLNCKSFGIYAAICIRCGKIMSDKPKIVLVQDGTTTEQIGKKFNQILLLRTFLMNMLCLNNLNIMPISKSG